MKTSKDSQVLGLITKLQEQVSSLDKKIDLIMGRVMATPALLAQPPKAATTQQQPKEKMMYKIICADCGKESSLPFKPSQDRPVYCKECFNLRRSGKGPIKAESSKPAIAPSLAPMVEIKFKKKTKPAKKTVAKKKATTKKKK